MSADTLAHDLAAFSARIDAGLYTRDAATYARVAKITEEAGELSAALLRYNGHNVLKEDGEPTRDEIGRHMLSVAITALGAYEHWTGNHGASVDDLTAQVRALVGGAA